MNLLNLTILKKKCSNLWIPVPINKSHLAFTIKPREVTHDEGIKIRGKQAKLQVTQLKENILNI